MNIHQAVEFIEGSEKFQSFSKGESHYYLVHGFCMVEKEQSPWQVGYYSQETEKIVVFTAADDVLQSPADEAFREAGHVPPLRLEEVKVSLEQALAAASKLRQDKYAREIVMKSIVLLQSIDGKAAWNMTLVTQAFNMLNIRVDARSGDVISSSLQSLMSLGNRA